MYKAAAPPPARRGSVPGEHGCKVRLDRWIPSCTNSSATGCCAKMVGNASRAGRCQILRFTATNFVARPVTIQRRP